MRKWVLILIILPTLAKAQKTFLIKGNLKSIPENSQVILLGFNGTDTLAKSKVQQGVFILNGTVDNIDARIVLFPELQRRLVLFMGNDTINITGNSEFSDIT